MIRNTNGCSRMVSQCANLIRSANSKNTVESTVSVCARRSHTKAQSKPDINIKSGSDKFLHYSEEEGYYKTSPFEPVATPNVKINEYVWNELGRWQDKTAAVCVSTGRDYTYAQLRDCSAAIAYRFRKVLNLKPRDVVAICLPNLPEYPIATLGAFDAGLTVTTINPIYTADEIAKQLSASNAKFIICLNEGYQVVKQACDIAQKQMKIACIRQRPAIDVLPEGAIDFFELINPKGVDFSDIPQSYVSINDLAFLPFSSGTTGMPKGVMLKHSNITINCEQVQAKLPYRQFVSDATETYQDSIPCVLPFFHIYGLTVNMISKLRLGCKLVTIPRFTPDDLIKSLIDYKGTVLNLVPPIILFMINTPKLTAENIPQLRLIMSGAAPIGAMDVEKFVKKFPQTEFAQGYGLTETSPCVLLTPNDHKKYASAGFPPGNTQCKIVSFDQEDGTGVGPNQTGELCVRGPQVMEGYLNNDEATKATFYPGGWLRTGDVGYYDETGLVYITDRMKELIKVKGFQVPPAELEEILRSHEKVLDAAVIGIPHDLNGEAPKGVVVLRPGTTATEDEIKDFVASKVATYKKLEGGVDFIDAIPKNLSGKILRRELKAKYC